MVHDVSPQTQYKKTGKQRGIPAELLLIPECWKQICATATASWQQRQCHAPASNFFFSFLFFLSLKKRKERKSAPPPGEAFITEHCKRFALNYISFLLSFSVPSLFHIHYPLGFLCRCCSAFSLPSSSSFSEHREFFCKGEQWSVTELKALGA